MENNQSLRLTPQLSTLDPDDESAITPEEIEAYFECDLFTVSEFVEACKHNCISPYDGNVGAITIDGAQTEHLKEDLNTMWTTAVGNLVSLLRELEQKNPTSTICIEWYNK